MTIHVVQPGENLEAIAGKYKIPLWLLSKINGLAANTSLVEGQAILILFPALIHTVVPGDTLYNISAQYDLSLRELFRNNPGLITKNYIYPGEPIVIHYESAPSQSIMLSGYAYPFIDISLFLQTLPYVTDFNSFTYEITEEGHLSKLGDDLLISLSKKLGTRPHMVISNLREPYGFDTNIVRSILGNRQTWTPLIEEILSVLKTKHYDGVDVDFEYVAQSDRESYPEFMSQLHRRLFNEGYTLTAALAAKTQDNAQGLLVEGIDYKALGAAADAVLLMTYEWGYAAGEPMAIAPLPKVKEVLDYAITQIPSEKILLGIPDYGYNWPLSTEKANERPRASSLGNAQAVNLARSTGSVIHYDEESQAPWFSYTQNGIMHEVWFEDARSILAKLSLIPQYKLKGAGYWNLMRPFPQNWPLLNSLYKL